MAVPDYWLWSICEAEVRRVKPETLDELKDIVSTYVDSLEPGEVRKAVANIRKRAEVCIKMGCGLT